MADNSIVGEELAFPKAFRDESKVYTYTSKKTEVKDPYHSLEDADASDTKNFVEQLNTYSKARFADDPSTQRVIDTLTEAWVYERVSNASEQGGHFFYFGHNGVQNHSVYYKRTDKRDVPFLDVNQLSTDGSVSLHCYDWSDDTNEAILGYGLSAKGSDNYTIQFRKVNGEDLPDKIPNAKFGPITFYKRQGVFYAKYLSEKSKDVEDDNICTKALQYHALFYHEFGTDAENDILVYERPDNDALIINACVSHCNKYLIITVYRGCDLVNEVFIWQITDPIPDHVVPITISSEFTEKIDFIGNVEDKMFYLTNRDGATFYKILAGKLNDCSKLVEVVPERKGFVLQGATVYDTGILLHYTTPSLETLVEFCSHSGEKLHTIYQGFDKLSGFSNWFGKDVTYFNKESFTTPVVIQKLTLKEKPVIEIIAKSGTEQHDYSDRLEVSDGWARSSDGEKVHYFMMKPKNMRSAGPRPVLFYGYGGFQISLSPGYSTSRPIFVTNYDAIYVLVNCRGGGEFGDDFYQAGRLLKKTNVFDDFNSVVADFIDRGVTTPQLTAIEGGSNGGLLVAACARRAPEILGAVVCHVGVLDMLRYPKFTIGCAWVPEFGDPESDEHFVNLMSYSPYHNLASADLQNYPNMLVLTADHDDRVVPGHSLKYLAELYFQAEKQKVANKLFAGVITTDAGHGAGKPTYVTIRETAVVFSFLEKTLGLEWQK
ncbi:unnamed protein product [Caenorhabditis auriculariae]|uniref:Prolyl endopeptidase n=1 Tax=Caenorhabditis auriculariae TaxID=2777116 RepID=A0A8S1GUB4_9PELO|nr:unnamed protein product [Caenorhabditis auriculariae]